MKGIVRLEFKPKEGSRETIEAQKKLDLLYRIFNNCLSGSEYVQEALEAAEMLVEYLGSSEVKKIPGLVLPKWEDDLARFFIRQGLIHHAREAARLRNKPLTDDELSILNRVMKQKKTVKNEFDKLAVYFCEEGRLEEAFLAAKLAGRSLTVEEIERIKGSHMLLSFRNTDRNYERR